MSRWFPRSDNKPGVNKALAAGSAGALIVAGVSALSLVLVVSRTPHLGSFAGDFAMIGWLVGGFGRILIALIAAWRFAIGKGLVLGPVVLVLFLLPLAGYFYMGTAMANIGWVVVRIPAAAALIAGIRGASLRQGVEPDADYAEVFE